MRSALTIAGSDSGGGAGIQADLKTFAAHHVHGLCAVTAVTAQDTIRVTAIHVVPVDIVASQIETVRRDFDVGAVKTGMLASRATVELVVEALSGWGVPSVIDPVVLSTQGTRLLPEDAIETLRSKLLPRATCVTPNRAEAELLTGRPIESLADARDAARRIVDLGVPAVVITGGHLPAAQVVDILYDGHDIIEFAGSRLEGPATHGTGCTFSAAVAAALAQGHPLADAVRRANSYVRETIRRSVAVGAGGRIPAHF